MTRTFGIIKPDAVKNKHVGGIVSMIEAAGFTIAGMRLLTMTKEQAGDFYAVHKERPFYGELVEFMTEGPVVVLALEAENAVQKWRDLMGATNPANAAEGTIRKKYAESIGRNAVHGSDSPENAAIELKFFF